jgi:hypothetical protein
MESYEEHQRQREAALAPPARERSREDLLKDAQVCLSRCNSLCDMHHLWYDEVEHQFVVDIIAFLQGLSSSASM